MTTAARELLKAFDALSPTEQKEVVNEILRRTVGEGDLPTAALDELADELFRSYDAEEAERGKQPHFTDDFMEDRMQPGEQKREAVFE